MEDPLDNVSETIGSHCRLCAEQKVYSELLDLSSDVKTYAEYLKIIDYLKIDYLDLSHANKLPKTTCEKCYDVFQEAYMFIRKLNDSQFVLKALYDVNVKMEPKETNKLEIEMVDVEEGSDNSDDKSKPDTRLKKESLNDSKSQLSHCRFCAEKKISNDLINLSDNKSTFDEYMKIINFFKINCLQTQKKLPKTSCISCHNSLTSTYKFFQNIKQNQIRLHNIYNIKSEQTHSIFTVKVEDITGTDTNSETNPATFCTVTINESNVTWNSYPWNCCHCQVLFESADELRAHSKEKHNMCYAFSCADCADEFGAFNEFVEHVREHRKGLRLCCQFCNECFVTIEQCSEHVNTHYIGMQKICELCGEMLPYANILIWHKKLYGEKTPTEYKRKQSRSWEDYEWACQECSLKTPDVASLREHTQTAHGKCFAMKCSDCSKVTKTYKLFVEHVTAHRPYLRTYCLYCNSHYNDIKDLNQHIIKHITSQQRPCNICGQIFEDNIQLAIHKRTFNPYSGPVKQENTTKRRSVNPDKKTTDKPGRKKRTGTLSTEDLTCRICSKLFHAMPNLTRHLKTHNLRSRDFVCQTCGRAFLTNTTLKEHAITHNSVKTEVCQVCKKEFHTKHKLKAHIVTHSELRPFVCDECGNSFKTKKRLKCHLKSHSTLKPFKCLYCYKDFKFKENLKTHEYQHTGVRPYTCEMCERTFTNWTNCNKHMIRKHGVTLARTKITSQGRVAINRRTGEAKKIASDKSAKEWLDKMMKREKPGRKIVK